MAPKKKFNHFLSFFFLLLNLSLGFTIQVIVRHWNLVPNTRSSSEHFGCKMGVSDPYIVVGNNAGDASADDGVVYVFKKINGNYLSTPFLQLSGQAGSSH